MGVVPGLLTLLIRAWVPESPRWLMRMGRFEQARTSLAWALEIDPAQIPLTGQEIDPQQTSRLRDIFRYSQKPGRIVLGELVFADRLLRNAVVGAHVVGAASAGDPGARGHADDIREYWGIRR